MFFTLLKTITRTRLSYFVISSKEHLAWTTAVTIYTKTLVCTVVCASETRTVPAADMKLWKRIYVHLKFLSQMLQIQWQDRVRNLEEHIPQVLTRTVLTAIIDMISKRFCRIFAAMWLDLQHQPGSFRRLTRGNTVPIVEKLPEQWKGPSHS